MSDLAKSILNAIRRSPELGPKLSEMEAIDAEVAQVVEYVDLGIAFSPVLDSGATSTLEEIVVDYKGQDGRYVVTQPTLRIIPADELKVMRARWLIVNGREQQPRIDRMFPKRPE